jgi:hypothetical protein
VKEKSLGLFQLLSVATSVPLGNFTDAELALMRLYMRQYTEEQRMRDRMKEAFGKDAVMEQFPELAIPDIDYNFIEVDFDQAPNEAGRDYLNSIPTAFKLKREQVDKLREAAGTILDVHPGFQKLVTELK